MPKDKDDDDVSSLGDEEEFEQVINTGETPNVQDIADLEELADKLAGEHELVINGFRCPDEYVNVLTPMEFEEMVKMFIEYDVDGSGTIDKVSLQDIKMFLYHI